MEAKAKFLKPAAMKYLEIYFSQKSECDNKFKKIKSPVFILNGWRQMEAKSKCLTTVAMETAVAE